ncbi:hypothetical protein V2J09_011277, partial [Rumex salicifolius]
EGSHGTELTRVAKDGILIFTESETEKNGFPPEVMAETILEEGDAKVAICDAVSKYNISILVLAEQHMEIIKGSKRLEKRAPDLLKNKLLCNHLLWIRLET